MENKMKMTDDVDVYITKDLPLASALLSLRQRLLHLKNEGSHFIFIFQNNRTCEKLANAFLNRELTVDAKTYAESLRTLKDKIFQQKQKNNQ